jgi:hypothetical protein
MQHRAQKKEPGGADDAAFVESEEPAAAEVVG